MSKRRTERLLSIVVLLLSARRYLTAEEIRAAVHGYPEQDDAFKRMFERDKEELRDLGIPLETGRPFPLDDETGYRISRQDYELPDIHLEADEAAMLGLAARVWESALFAGTAAGAVQKLRAASPDDDDGADDDASRGVPRIEPRLHTQEPAFGPLWEAVRDHRLVTFGYRSLGSTETLKRTLEPWGVVNRNGRWYVVGHDRLRDAMRVFRLSRIEGPVKMAGPPGGVTVPEGTDVRKLVLEPDKAEVQRGDATLRVRAGTGHSLRRRTDARIEPDGPGWDLVRVSYPLEAWYVEHLASYGPDVVVLGPPDLRDAVIRHLKGVLS
jgi:proteasome accessory factor B